MRTVDHRRRVREVAEKLGDMEAGVGIEPHRIRWVAKDLLPVFNPTVLEKPRKPWRLFCADTHVSPGGDGLFRPPP